MSLLGRTQSFLQAKSGVAFAEKTYLLAISGGLDSMVLLETMARLVGAAQLKIGHFNHHLRESSQRDEILVGDRSRQLGIECFVGHRKTETTSEAALREERLAFLNQTRIDTRADYILTAHHADDQLETFLMRLLRGAGVDGLASMRAASEPWLRPFLSLPRSALAAQADRWGVAFHHDETNFTDGYLRNRIRRRVTPSLQELAVEFGGPERFLERFSLSVEELQWASDFLDRETERLYASTITETLFWFRFSRESFLKLDSPLQARLLRRLFQRLGQEVPDRPRVETVRAIIRDNIKGHAAPGARIRLSCDQVFFQTEAQRLRQLQPLAFQMSDGLWQCPSLGFSLRGVAEAFPGSEVRFFQPGDRYRSSKLKLHWLERRIPQPERRLVPILVLPGSCEVAWHYPEPHPALKWEGPTFPFSFRG